MITEINNPSNVVTNESVWWFIFDNSNKTIIIDPMQCCGITSSPFTMVIADTKEEADQFISDNGIHTAQSK
jgi:hypothetical protein